jgi:hypothetical protein
MGMKIKTKRAEARRLARRKRRRRDDIVEVGHGQFNVMTINRHDGSVVVQRFETAEEARAQHERNVAADAPLVDVTEPN